MQELCGLATVSKALNDIPPIVLKAKTVKITPKTTLFLLIIDPKQKRQIRIWRF
mgnify:CR=1 FL=1